ncbi:hypothetical protein [Desulfosarcina sp.]|uniref:hypothetical protein n=1 Tax=Desulfosarcina sp. TaxID=2027861 RepID=UPI003970979F
MRKPCTFLFVCLAALALCEGYAWSGDDAARAFAIIQRYGENIGGPESVRSLIELNMKDWKPQASRGIEIFGWQSQPAGPYNQKVVYSYIEHGESPIQIIWQVDLKSETIVPLNILSERIMQMACIL